MERRNTKGKEGSKSARACRNQIVGVPRFGRPPSVVASPGSRRFGRLRWMLTRILRRASVSVWFLLTETVRVALPATCRSRTRGDRTLSKGHEEVSIDDQCNISRKNSRAAREPAAKLRQNNCTAVMDNIFVTSAERP
uniref:(northern house mosquito) hypothetical protein n=1 Tax=Culex pipiens TaxID=7175 RepID=A0A8D8BME6_CULPI